jgi:hypothetical protein
MAKTPASADAMSRARHRLPTETLRAKDGHLLLLHMSVTYVTTKLTFATFNVRRASSAMLRAVEEAIVNSGFPSGMLRTAPSGIEQPVPLSEEADLVRRAWWLHDATWYAIVARRYGAGAAAEINLEAVEKAVRGFVLQLRRQGALRPPTTPEELCDTFFLMWRLLFPGGAYLDTGFTVTGDEAVWIGTECHAFDQVRRAGMVQGYQCGCRAIRDGFARGLGISLEHSIEESLVRGDPRCVIRLRLTG